MAEANRYYRAVLDSAGMGREENEVYEMNNNIKIERRRE
jgi:hypothetical protein